MTNYYNNESAKVALSHVLKEKGWEIFGYKADESDSMTDYFSPANWDGVATKEGFVLIIDQYSNRLSGHEVKKYNYSQKRSNSSKIEKLKAMIDDKATTQGEKENAQNLIEKLNGKSNTPSYEVLYTYPTFEHKTPKSCVWHIEKDGAIIAKGKGLYSLYEINDRELTKSNMINFAEKLENHIKGNEQLVAVQKEIKTKSLEIVEANSTEFITNKTMIKLNCNFTGGFYKGAVLMYTEDFLNRKVFVRTGKKHQALKATPKNQLTLSSEKLSKWIEDGSITIVELKEVEKVEVKTVYVKSTRKQKAVSEEFQVGTTIVQNEETTTTEEIKTIQEDITTEETTTTEVTYKLNDEKNGIEIYFDNIPTEEIRENLKSNGFRWSRYNKCWYAKQSEENISLAKKLTGEGVNSSDKVEVILTDIELVEFVEVDNYKINEETEKRLIDNSLFGDMRKVGYETKSLQSTLNDLLVETKSVIELTDSVYQKNKLINGFNSFCERYTREMSGYLYTKSTNPSWTVTGRGGLNIARYNKKQDAIFNKMGKVVEMLEKQESVLKKYRNRFESEKVYKTKQSIQSAIDNLEGFTLSFETSKREIEYHGYKYNTRTYNSPNYFMMNIAGCYRIFERSSGKEVHSMKTTDKLTDAKKHVLYLEHVRNTKQTIK